MRLRQRFLRAQEKTSLHMTAMIDIVFLLLVFFIFTFRIVEPEGDFLLAIPPAQGPRPVEAPEIRTVEVVIRADADGEPVAITVDGLPLKSETQGALWQALNGEIRGIVERSRRVGQMEVAFQCDTNLKYAHLIAAVTAVTGYVDERNESPTIKKLIRRFRFERRSL